MAMPTECSNSTPLWHIVAQLGATDAFVPQMRDSEPRLMVSFAKAGDRAGLSNNMLETLQTATGRTPDPHVFDLLHLAGTVFSADLRVPRSVTEDRWRRRMHVYFPALRPDVLVPAVPLLGEMLGFLTGDEWSFDIREAGTIAWPAPPKAAPESPPSVNAVSLFSGGLDSLVGAIDLLSGGGNVALVGHHGKGFTNPIQQQVLTALRSAFPDKIVEFMFYVQPPKDGAAGEQSMRSRSFLFLVLGTASAHCLGWGGPLTVPENGFISLNAPLTRTRLGSLSTRTTHPHFMAQFNQLIRMLGIATVLENPYRFSTKGEMLRNCRNRPVLARATPLTMSCSHPEVGRFQGHTPGNHCGYCYPCLIRRAAAHAASVPDATYDLDVTTHPPAADTLTGSDFRAVKIALARFGRDTPSLRAMQAVATGPLPVEDLGNFAGVYARGMAELQSLYP